MLQDLIILNEIQDIPGSLLQVLGSFIKSKGNLVIIPAMNFQIKEFNGFMTDLGFRSLDQKVSLRHKITRINHDHPFFSGVFKKRIDNFHYPYVNEFYFSKYPIANHLLSFQNGAAFLIHFNYFDQDVYLFTAPVNQDNSNFTASPLVVPVFYNFSLVGQKQKTLFFPIGAHNTFWVEKNSSDQQPLVLSLDEQVFIPHQSRSSNKIRISTLEDPIKPGLYDIIDQDQVVQQVAFNYDGKESQFKSSFFEIPKNVPDNIRYFTSLNEGVKSLNDSYEIKTLWQLFIIFALVFLVLEIALQKLMKG